MKTLIVIAVVWVALIGVVAYFMHNAPEGYEDDDGFHYKQ
jgi:hypothetical protein